MASPQVCITQTTPSEFARLRFQVSGQDPWDIAVGGVTGGVMNFFAGGPHDKGNVMTLTRSGDVRVPGHVTKAACTFKIDHPLDPGNKYLSHSVVESPEMLNLYSGTATTGQEGLAVVELPAYFEALNRDVRYQLTPIGEPVRVSVFQEVRNNRFVIKTEQPHVRVSWMVTGVRQDVYAQAHPIIVEEEKNEDERGHYLHPTLHGQPSSRHVWAKHMEAAQQTAPMTEP